MCRPRLQALEAAKTAIGRFEAAGIAWQRPADYYAQMVRCWLHTAACDCFLVAAGVAAPRLAARRPADCCTEVVRLPLTLGQAAPCQQLPIRLPLDSACQPKNHIPRSTNCLQVKSDEHMAKVKEQLLFEKQQIEAAEQR